MLDFLNKYLYNGKEIQNDVLSGTEIGILDYGARSYDPLIGRMKEIDPLIDKLLSFSPFVYSFNNPVRDNDPSGMSSDDTKEGDYNEETVYDIARGLNG